MNIGKISIWNQILFRLISGSEWILYILVEVSIHISIAHIIYPMHAEIHLINLKHFNSNID